MSRPRRRVRLVTHAQSDAKVTCVWDNGAKAAAVALTELMETEYIAHKKGRMVVLR